MLACFAAEIGAVRVAAGAQGASTTTPSSDAAMGTSPSTSLTLLGRLRKSRAQHRHSPQPHRDPLRPGASSSATGVGGSSVSLTAAGSAENSLRLDAAAVGERHRAIRG